MRYVLLIYGDEAGAADVSPERWQEVIEGHRAWGAEARSRGILEGGEALQPTATATTLRMRNGQPVTTDGPFAETKEQLGGFYILDCRDLDEALEMAAKLPLVESDTVEIRPIMTFD
ncbi:MAG: YciI family protein [Candidatus Promineifilaceae bacterium]|nr:YciI family protein [Candidatus Promineifilaceae bacterium]